MKKFYLLKRNDFMTEKGHTDTEYYKTNPTNFGEPLHCPVCDKRVSSKQWLPPYQIELIMRTKLYGNIVFGAGTIDLIVDGYFKDCFEKSDMAGLDFLSEIEITKIICYNGVKRDSLEIPPQYYVARMKYGGVMINHEKSGSVFGEGEEPACPYCQTGLINGYRRIIVDENSWDGSDIFLARGIGGMVIVSQKFRDWWDSCHFNNGKLIPSEEDRWGKE